MELFAQDGNFIMTNLTILFHLLSFLFYMVSLVKIWLDKRRIQQSGSGTQCEFFSTFFTTFFPSAVNSTNHRDRVLKALILIMAVQLGQWCMGIIGNLIMGTMEPATNMVQMFEIAIGLSCVVTFLMLIEVPILFCARFQY
jgi:hypothetical protein